ncbi:MAG: hypothetical protein IT462_14885 [Planctomycetes bacterium]|nr:hypothetical protein [Planctomycetota bacterium]
MKDPRIMLTGIIALIAISFVTVRTTLAAGPQACCIPINQINQLDVIGDRDDTSGGIYLGLGVATPIAGEIKRMTNGNKVLQFYLRNETQANDTVTAISFSNGGNAQPADWDNFKLYYDKNGNGNIDAPDDTLDATALTGSTTFSFTRTIPKGETVYFIMTCDVSLAAVVGRTVDIGITTSQVTLSVNGRPYATNISGNTMTIAPSMSNISLSGQVGVIPNTVQPGSVSRGSVNAPVMQFSITADGTGTGGNLISTLVEAGAGNTAGAADIAGMRIYRESGLGNGVVDGLDTPLGSYGASQGGVSFLFTFSDTIAASTTAVYLVTADIMPNATNGNIIKLMVRQSGLGTNATWLGGLTSFTEDDRTIADPLAVRLDVTVDPVNTVAGQYIRGAASANVHVVARTSGGAIDTTFTGQISAVLETAPVGGAFTVASVTSVAASAGEADFANLAIIVAGTYRIKFSSAPIPSDPSDLTEFFDIVHGNANKLVLAVAPADGEIGLPVSPSPVIHVTDLYGNICTNYNNTVVATMLAYPSGAVMQGGSVDASSGVATFSAIILNRNGTYSLKFNSGGLIDVDSSTFNMAIGQPALLQVTEQPISTTGGAIITPSPKVRVTDAGGNVITGYAVNINVAIGNNPGGGTLSGNASVAPVNGESVFPGLSIDKAGVGYTLHFTSGALSVFSNSFSIVVGTATKLAVTTQPGNSTGGIALSQAPVVQVQDQGGNLITADSTTIIDVAITTGTGAPGATLGGVLALTVSGGQATFNGLSVDMASASVYTLTFTTTSAAYTAAISGSFTISVGPAARVGLSTQPGMATMGNVFVQQPVAEIQDLGGNTVTSSSALISVILDPTSPPGTTLQGTAAITAVSGVAAFTNLQINLPGLNFRLIFRSTGLVDAVSLPFGVASTATHLAVVMEPGQGVINAPLSVQPVIEVRDVNGVMVSADSFSYVTAEIISGTGSPGAMLSGQISVAVVNGTATFTNLQIPTQGLAYHLRFTSDAGLTPANSAAFNVAGVAVKAVITQQPVGGNVGEPLATQPKICIMDSNNIPVINDNTTVVSVYITPATGTAHAILGGSTTITAVGGEVEFTDIYVDRPGSAYRLSFSTLPMLQSVSTTAFDIVGAAPPPSGGSQNITGGVNGGSCALGHDNAPWMLLGLLMLALAGTALRRARQ